MEGGSLRECRFRKVVSLTGKMQMVDTSYRRGRECRPSELPAQRGRSHDIT